MKKQAHIINKSYNGILLTYLDGNAQLLGPHPKGKYNHIL